MKHLISSPPKRRALQTSHLGQWEPVIFLRLSRERMLC